MEGSLPTSRVFSEIGFFDQTGPYEREHETIGSMNAFAASGAFIQWPSPRDLPFRSAACGSREAEDDPADAFSGHSIQTPEEISLHSQPFPG
jgi:hypothetical protein